MARCTAPVQGHRTSSGAASCPACGGRSSYGSYNYNPPARYPTVGVGSSSGGSYGGGRSRRLRGGGSVSYTPVEWRTIEPLARSAEVQARSHPERRDLFL